MLAPWDAVKLLTDVTFLKSSRKLRVALVIPPSFDISKLWCPNLPIGLAYLAAVIEKSGHELKVFDSLALGLDHASLGQGICLLSTRCSRHYLCDYNRERLLFTRQDCKRECSKLNCCFRRTACNILG